MSEITLERRIESTFGEELAGSAGVVKAVFYGAKREPDDREDEHEGFVDIIVLAAKVKANTILRRMIRPR